MPIIKRQRQRRVIDRRSSPQNLPGDFQTAEELQRFNRMRKYAIGFKFTVATGPNTFPQVSFPGSARMMLGFTLFDTSGDPLNVATINLNNENVITNASWSSYTKTNQVRTVAGEISGSSFNGEFYVYPRALSGNDGIIVSYTGNSGGILLATFYFKTDLDYLEQ